MGTITGPFGAPQFSQFPSQTDCAEKLKLEIASDKATSDASELSDWTEVSAEISKTEEDFPDQRANYIALNENDAYFSRLEGKEIKIIELPNRNSLFLFLGSDNYHIQFGAVSNDTSLLGSCSTVHKLSTFVDVIKKNADAVQADLFKIQEWNYALGSYRIKTSRIQTYPLDQIELSLEHPDQATQIIGSGTLGALNFQQWRNNLNRLIPEFVTCQNLLCSEIDQELAQNQAHVDAKKALVAQLSKAVTPEGACYTARYYDIPSRSVKSSTLNCPKKSFFALSNNDSELVKKWLQDLLEANRSYIANLMKQYVGCGNLAILTGKSQALQLTFHFKAEEAFVMEGHDLECFKKLQTLSERIEANSKYFTFSIRYDPYHPPARTIEKGSDELRVTHVKAQNGSASYYEIKKYRDYRDFIKTVTVSDYDEKSLEEVTRALFNEEEESSS